MSFHGLLEHVPYRSETLPENHDARSLSDEFCVPAEEQSSVSGPWWLRCLFSLCSNNSLGAQQGGSSSNKTKSSIPENLPAFILPPSLAVLFVLMAVGGKSRGKMGGAGKKSKPSATSTPLQSAHNNLPVRVHRPYLASQKGDSVTKIARTVYLGGFNSSITVETDNYLSFQLSDLPAYTSLTAVYDSYRIRLVELFFCCTINTTTPVSNFGNPSIYVAVDFDSAAAQTINTVQAYDTCEWHDIRETFSLAIQPRVAMAAYNGAFAGYAEGRPDQWLDCASAGIQHYGVVFSQPSTTAVTQLEVNGRYHLEFKRSR